MASGHEQHETGHHGGHHGPKTLPASLYSNEVLSVWRTRALIVCAASTLLSLVWLAFPIGGGHILRAYMLGFMLCFTFAGGGLAMLMLQYVSGGKWGMLLRRPLEAMTRTLPLVFVMIVPVAFFAGHLYQWWAFPNPAATAKALAAGLMTKEQQLTADAKHAMFNPLSAIIQTIVVFSILGLLTYLLNKWSLERDADPARNTPGSYDKWRVRFENLSGPSIFLYVVVLTDGALLWIMSMDVTWYSSIWGLQFLVGQGFAVLAMSILTVVQLSKVEPMKTLLRVTEQHDLGKLAFAFVMLNMYLCFAEFLIIWSGNVPDEIPWYLARIRGGWWVVCAADATCHFFIPFCLLLSRQLKRNKKLMTWLCIFMLFARSLDLFWLIEPNFHDAAGNLTGEPLSVFAYVTVPLAMLSLWAAFYFYQLAQRPLVNINDPHLAEMLEPEHAH
jgi:hypothetical protein